MGHDFRTGLDPASLAKVEELGPTLRAIVTSVLDECRGRGVFLRILYTGRSPQEQARLWRRSRSSADVAAALKMLRASGAPWLASVLEGVGPQASGPWATNALPGQSWHQHLQAIDVAWMVDGRDADTLVDDLTWDTSPGSGYATWRTVGKAHGLHQGPDRDWAHMQGPADSAPRFAWRELDAMMRGRWS